MTLPGQSEYQPSFHDTFRQKTAQNSGIAKEVPLMDCPPKAEARGSNPLGCATFSKTYRQFKAPFAGACPGYVRVTALCAPSAHGIARMNTPTLPIEGGV